MAEKYNQKDRDEAAKSGAAMSDGSYPIKDSEDLQNAIHAVGRGGADHDSIRKHVIARAKALGLSSKIPDNWNADGSLRSAMNSEQRQNQAKLLGGREVRTLGTVDVETREESDGMLRFHGLASSTDNPYSMGWYSETVARGAFKKTLSESPNVQFLLNHSGVPMARTTNGSLDLREDARGLVYDATCSGDDPVARDTHMRVKAGLLAESSFAFQTILDAWNDDFDERNLLEVSLSRGDVSVVGNGANPDTPVVARSQDALTFLQGMTPRQLGEIFAEVRAGAALSSTGTAVLKHILSLCSTADTAVDEAQMVLSEYLGVKNPDIAQDAAMHDGDEAKGLALYEARLRILAL